MKTTLKVAALGLTLLGLASAAQAKEVAMLFGLALPPYVIQENSSGFEVDIIRAALAHKGHTLKPVYASFSLITQTLHDNKADAAQRGNPDLVDGQGYFYADSQTVFYQDMAITLKKNNLAINNMNDLKGKNVVAFQGASKFLGPEFGMAVAGNPRYTETANEQKKVQQLYANGMEVFVGDVNIFKFFRAKASGVDTQQEIVYHKIFANADIKYNHAVFKDKQIRDDFDAGLKQLKSSGKYQEIIKKYVAD